MEEMTLGLDLTRALLRELDIPVHQNGYAQLCIGLPYFAQKSKPTLSKELYPYIAEEFGGVSADDVESSIRRSIKFAWSNRDPAVWEKYFPKLDKPPSNLVFIATLAEYLK